MMDTLDRIIELSGQVAALRARRAEVAQELARVDLQIDGVVLELKQYVPSLGNGSGHGTESAKKSGRTGGYRKGSVAHRILDALATVEDIGLTGADLTLTTGTQNKQIHALLARMVPAGHVEKKPDEARGSRYFITEAGRTALAKAWEGGTSDELESTA